MKSCYVCGQLIKMSELSKRQAQVARYAVMGLRSLDIARKLKITDKTVKYHLTDIYKKLGVNGRYELIYMVTSDQIKEPNKSIIGFRKK